MPEKMMREVQNLPGTKIEPSRVDLSNLSGEDRQKTLLWLNDAGAVIVSANDQHVSYYL